MWEKGRYLYLFHNLTLVMHIVVHFYTAVVLQNIVHCCIVVVVKTIAWYYTMDDARYYATANSQVVFSLTQPAPYMHPMSSPSLSQRFYSPCLRVQLTYKYYKMYSLVLFDTFAS
jgi:hypothetical protein